MPSPRILVVEDDALTRLAMDTALTQRGYAVVSANGYDEAIKSSEHSATKFDVLITDIRLGNGKNGWSLAQQVREHIPDIIVIYVTGDSTGDWSTYGVSGSVVFGKPVHDDKVADYIAQRLIPQKHNKQIHQGDFT